jgi:hypothetical protein
MKDRYNKRSKRDKLKKEEKVIWDEAKEIQN